MSIPFFRAQKRRFVGNRNRCMAAMVAKMTLSLFCAKRIGKNMQNPSLKKSQKTGRKYRFYSQFFYAFLLVKLKKM